MTEAKSFLLSWRAGNEKADTWGETEEEGRSVERLEMKIYLTMDRS